MFLTAGPPFSCIDFYGKTISYQGVSFEGSPCDVFWGGFIERFLRDLIVRVIDDTARRAKNRGLAPRRPMNEAAGLLKGAVSGAYQRMQEVDQCLRGAGYPDRITAQPIDAYVHRMGSFIDQIITGRLTPKPFPRRLEDFYRAHGFLFWTVRWAIVGVISLVAL